MPLLPQRRPDRRDVIAMAAICAVMILLLAMWFDAVPGVSLIALLTAIAVVGACGWALVTAVRFRRMKRTLAAFNAEMGAAGGYHQLPPRRQAYWLDRLDREL